MEIAIRHYYYFKYKIEFRFEIFIFQLSLILLSQTHVWRPQSVIVFNDSIVRSLDINYLLK